MSAPGPMDWEATHREQQRQITASKVEAFKRREKIRRQHLEDALEAMKPKPSARTPEEVAEVCARLERLKVAALDDGVVGLEAQVEAVERSRYKVVLDTVIAAHADVARGDISRQLVREWVADLSVGLAPRIGAQDDRCAAPGARDGDGREPSSGESG